MRDKWEAYIWLIILVGLPLIRWLAVLLGKLIQGGQPPRPSPLARDLRPTPGRRPTPPRRPPMMLVEEDEEDGQVMAQAQRAADPARPAGRAPRPRLRPPPVAEDLTGQPLGEVGLALERLAMEREREARDAARARPPREPRPKAPMPRAAALEPARRAAPLESSPLLLTPLTTDAPGVAGPRVGRLGRPDPHLGGGHDRPGGPPAHTERLHRGLPARAADLRLMVIWSEILAPPVGFREGLPPHDLAGTSPPGLE